MADTGLKSPTASGEDYTAWGSATRAYASNDQWAEGGTDDEEHDYYDFAFGVPGSATIDGIEVKLEAKGDSGDEAIEVELSWDSGPNYTTSGKTTGAMTTSDVIYTLGGATDTWGRSWSDTEFSDANFRARVTADLSSGDECLLDHIQVKVYYTEVAAGVPAQMMYYQRRRRV